MLTRFLLRSIYKLCGVTSQAEQALNRLRKRHAELVTLMNHKRSVQLQDMADVRELQWMEIQRDEILLHIATIKHLCPFVQ